MRLDFPLPVDSYHDQEIPSLFGKLMGRIQREPLNLIATIIFFGAIIHTFLAARFRKIAHIYQQSYEAIEYLLHAKDGPPDYAENHDKLLFRAQLFYFMGEVEAVFGVWLINPAFCRDYCVPTELPKLAFYPTKARPHPIAGFAIEGHREE